MKTQNNIVEQFNNLTLLKIFEIEAVSNIDQKTDYIVFKISIRDGKFIAEHKDLTYSERRMGFTIPFESIEIDEDFSLDQNLESLYEACNYAVLESDFYTLSEQTI